MNDGRSQISPTLPANGDCNEREMPGLPVVTMQRCVSLLKTHSSTVLTVILGVASSAVFGQARDESPAVDTRGAELFSGGRRRSVVFGLVVQVHGEPQKFQGVSLQQFLHYRLLCISCSQLPPFPLFFAAASA